MYFFFDRSVIWSNTSRASDCNTVRRISLRSKFPTLSMTTVYSRTRTNLSFVRGLRDLIEPRQQMKLKF